MPPRTLEQLSSDVLSGLASDPPNMSQVISAGRAALNIILPELASPSGAPLTDDNQLAAKVVRDAARGILNHAPELSSKSSVVPLLVASEPCQVILARANAQMWQNRVKS